MISKELFISTLEILRTGLTKDVEDLWYACLKLLAASVEDEDEVLFWWVFDCDYGRNNPELTIGIGGKKEKTIYLDTPQKLYDFFYNSF